MALRVTIRRKNEEVPEDFIYSVVMSVFSMNKEEYDKIKNEDGSVTLFVNDPQLIVKLQQVHDKHGDLIDISFDKVQDDSFFTASINAVKSNWGLALSWSAIFFVLMLISVVPLIGFVASILYSAFMNAFVICVADRLFSNKGKGVNSVFAEMKIGEVFSSYIGSGFGLWLGLALISIGLAVVFLILAFVFGGMGAITDMVQYGNVGGGTATSLFVVIALFFIVGMWVFYVMPMVVARVVEKGASKFEAGFMGAISLFHPNTIKESFSNSYLKIGGIWTLVASVGILLFVIAIMLIITLPVAILILYWMNIFLGMSAYRYLSQE